MAPREALSRTFEMYCDLRAIGQYRAADELLRALREWIVRYRADAMAEAQR